MRTNQSRPGELVKMIQPPPAKPLQHKFRRSMRNSSIINPALPKGCVANCIWPDLIWSVALIREGGPNLGGLESRQNVATIQSSPKVSQLVY